MNTLPLPGCAPVPLAHYLKALGVLRLVSEQCPDSGATGHWQGNTFVLTSTLDREALLKFFLEAYRPTPIIAPWNGGGGFFYREEKSKEKELATGKLKKTGVRNQPTAATRAIDCIADSSSKRLSNYSATVDVARQIIRKLGLHEAPKDEQKAEALTLFRNSLSDAAVKAFDTSIVLTEGGAAYPPLMGTGGTDGNLDFTCNFVQRLLDVIEPQSGNPQARSECWLISALFSDASAGVTADAAIGQFFPSASGGVNATSGFDGASAVNPWDFILMIEGALMFAASAVKRLESSGTGQLAYPFSVRSVGVGYGSSTTSDEGDSRGEIWLPIWEQPSSLSELQAVFCEGRSQVNGRPAKNAVDFARAVASLGVDRGIANFQRYAFLKRNGKNYFATPLDRVIVKRNQLATQLLAPLDHWLERFRRAARTDGAPASVQRAARNLESAIMAFCKASDPERVQELLISLGECESALAGSWKWTQESFIPFLPLLSSDWLCAANTGTTEFRLAASLASTIALFGNTAVPLRCHLEPVSFGGGREKRWFKWTETAGTNVVWREGDLADALNAILARRIVLSVKSGCKSYPDKSRIPARPSDIALFIEGRTDDTLLSRLFWGLSLIDFGGDDTENFKIGFPPERRDPPALYAMLKPCFSRKTFDTEIPLVAAIHRRASAGNGTEASVLAARRLRASGLSPAVESVPSFALASRRTAAALLFPLTENDLGNIAGRVLRTTKTDHEATAEIIQL